jgi:lysine/ornithine N-monooxygenase/predicted FMN-binding regulatory protein PaiB
MMLDGARMQISFLKDLVTLRNPSSPYSFLHYLKARGRLEHFVNLGQFRATRVEYDDYLRWVAAAFSEQVRYNAIVKRVTPMAVTGNHDLSLFRLEVEDARSGEHFSVDARNVVYSAGGRPHIPAGVPVHPPQVLHSSEFLQHFPRAFPDRDRTYAFAVVGGGQSAGEIVEYLLDNYLDATVHLIISGYAPRPTDNSPFVNEQFFSARVDAFYRADPPTRASLLQELRDANYGVIHEEVLDRLYNTAYLDAVKGRQRLFIHSSSRLLGVQESNDDVVMSIGHRFDGSRRVLRSDALILATGYDRSLDPAIFAELLDLAEKDASGELVLSRNCRVRTAPSLRAGLYVQGYGESLFGVGDTLLSLLPFRSKEIVDDICAHAGSDRRRRPRLVADATAPDGRAAATTVVSAAPMEHDLDKLHHLLERFRFATIITASGFDELIATHVPLVLDRSRGAKGILVGHVNKSDPQTDLIDGRRLLVLFSAPNGSLPTSGFDDDEGSAWCSMSVQVRGRGRIVDRAASISGPRAIVARSGPNSGSTADDPRLDELASVVVRFEIEIDELMGTSMPPHQQSEPSTLGLSAR